MAMIPGARIEEIFAYTAIDPNDDVEGIVTAMAESIEERQRRAKGRAEEEFETTTGGWHPREGSLYWYPLNMVQEIVVYPLLFGQARLVRGRRDKDSWEVGYDYPDVPTAMRAAGQWNGQGDPGYGWLQKHEEESGDGETDDLDQP